MWAIRLHSLITRGSDYFAAALKNERWIEGQQRIIKLPEEDPKAVQHYFDFVHGQGLPSKAIKTVRQLEDSSCYYDIAHLYVFAEYVGNTPVGNAILEEYLRLALLDDEDFGVYLPGEEPTSIIYEGTPATSPVRRLLVNLAVQGFSAEKLSTEGQHPEFMSEVIRALARWRPDIDHFSDPDNDIKSYLI